MWLHPFFAPSLLLGEDPMHRPYAGPCSAACSQLIRVLLGDWQWLSVWWGWLPVWLPLLQDLEERLQCTLPAGRCFHADTVLSHKARASLWTVTDGRVSAGGIAFPQAVLGTGRSCLCSNQSGLLVSSTTQTVVWEQRITNWFQGLFPHPIPCHCH